MRLRTSFLLIFSVVIFLFILSCVPQNGEDGARTALAGLAISKGCYDADNDGYGRSGRTISSCPGSRKVYDCDDNANTVYPGALEICFDLVDNDCDGSINEFCSPYTCADSNPTNDPTIPGNITIIAANGQIFSAYNSYYPYSYVFPFYDSPSHTSYHDSCNPLRSQTAVNETGCSSETFSSFPPSLSNTITACPEGLVCYNGTAGNGAYCGSATCVPSTEMCDGVDNDCDGEIDEGCDDDGDDYCDSTMVRASPYTCTSENPNCCSLGLDCDDFYPMSANEACNGYDDDCNGVVDDNCIACTQTDSLEDADANLEVAGSATGLGNWDNDGIQTLSDRCLDDSTLLEVSCVTGSASNSGRLLLADYNCIQRDYIGCRDGACVANGVCGNNLLDSGELCDDGNTINGDGCTQCRCADSDGGIDQYEGGTVTTSAGANNDYCDQAAAQIDSSRSIFERYCDASGNQQVIEKRCGDDLAPEYRNEFTATGRGCFTDSEDIPYCVVRG